MPDLNARRAKRILVAQAVTTLLIALLGSMIGLRVGLFALLGGLTATLGNALFAYWVFGPYRARESGRLVSQFYGGELAKLVFIAIAFAAIMIGLDPLSPLPLFGAFFVVQVLPQLLANRIAG